MLISALFKQKKNRAHLSRSLIEKESLWAHQKIGLMEKISPIKLYTKVKKSIEKNTNIRYNLIDEN